MDARSGPAVGEGQGMKIKDLVLGVLFAALLAASLRWPSATAAMNAGQMGEEIGKTPRVIPAVSANRSADMIFHNGTILTMESPATEVECPVAQAIAIQGERILAVGSDLEILALTGPETQVIDLAGQTVLPGLVDGHTHILLFSLITGRTLDEAQDVALSFGFTSVTEMFADEPFLEELMQAEEAGRLRLRVNAFAAYNDSILDENGNTIILKQWYPENDPVLDSDRKLRIPGIKVNVDGGSTPRRGCPALSEPYEPDFVATDWFKGQCGSDRGDLYWSQEELNQIVADAQAAGYRVAFHAMGDRAIEMVLNAIEFALDGQPNEKYRHQIQHNSLLRPDLLERYTSLDVLCSVRGYFNTCAQNDYIDYHGPDRYEWNVNRYKLPGLGIHVFLETDFTWDVDPADTYSSRNPNSMLHLYGLVTRQQVNKDGTICKPEPWLVPHAISVEQALRMMTVEPAYAVSQEDVLGTLEPGKFADLVILSHNPITVDPDSLKDLEVLMTMVGGNVEYCAPEHEALCQLSQPAPSSLDEPITATAPEKPGASVEPVTVSVFRDEERVLAEMPIVLTIGWLCDTLTQMADFIVAIALTITLDGQPLPDVADYWQEIEEAGDRDGDGDVDYMSRWLYPVGVLTHGTHLVESRGTLLRTVTDGFDHDEDGLPDEYTGTLWQTSLRIMVED